MKPRRTGTAKELASEILGYLSRHPEARDTAEGINQWWLMEQHIRRSLCEVKLALDELVRRGLVQRQCQADSRVFYGLDQRRKRREPVPAATGRRSFPADPIPPEGDRST